MTHALLEPLVARSGWVFGHPVGPAAAAAALRDWLADIAARCAAPGGHVMGHIKAYASLPAGGCLRGNATSARQPPDIELHAPGAASLAALDVTLNVLVVGLERPAAGRHVQASLDAVAALHGFTHSTSIAGPQGEH